MKNSSAAKKQSRQTTKNTGKAEAQTSTRKGSAGKSIKAGKQLKVAARGPKPASLNIRSYQVGFGDCFLLTFNYPKAAKPEDQARHILIDFGSTGLPPDTPKNQMMLVAEDIKSYCGGKLHMVVATHRHKDHISGFTTKEDGTGTGDIIAALNPDAVIQPWTEDPAALDPPALVKKKAGKNPTENKALDANALRADHLSSLKSMNIASRTMLAEVQHLSDKRLRQPLGAMLTEQIRFLADDNELPNKSAVDNLRTMGKNYYVSHGTKLNFSKLFPGININVLGPPTLEQHAAIQKQRSADKNEFWMLRAAAQQFWRQQAATGEMAEEFRNGKERSKDRLFPNANIISKVIPSHNRWFVRQVRAMRGEQMLGLVRILDKAMNNTSVILLFDVGGKKMLFSGDAQIENWEYSLSIDEDLKLLKDVSLYKVGHHCSRNATPKTLWENFERKSEKKDDKNRLKTIVSTMEGKHGDRRNNSEVPRDTLVEALDKSSEYHTTQNAARDGTLFEDITITF